MDRLTSSARRAFERQYATVEITDSVAAMGGHQVALVRGYHGRLQGAVQALESDVLNGLRRYHEMTAILDKIAAGELLGRRQDMATNQLLSHALEQQRTLKAIVQYQLSEDGRKASLLAGGDGRMTQTLTIDVPVNRLHLVEVNEQGSARLKLRPRFELDAEQRIVRKDSMPLFDAPPSIDDLYREAARNHQLSRAHVSQRTLRRTTQEEVHRERQLALAKAFLSDPTQRALLHPPPTPTRCYLGTEERRKVSFDVKLSDGIAREVPAEAFRRFRADVRALKQQKRHQRSDHDAVHEDKKRRIAEWLATHGTPDQQERFAAGLLTLDEARDVIAALDFEALNHLPKYQRNGAARLQAHLRQFPQYADVVVTDLELNVQTRNAPSATAGEWASMQQIREAVPDATVTLREREYSWKRDHSAPSITIHTVVVTRKAGSVLIRREFVLAEP
jgi:hypothetical protein